jgi:hypothetical protein
MYMVLMMYVNIREADKSRFLRLRDNEAAYPAG